MNTENTQMRLQRYLSLAGVASRRKAEDIIQAGGVSVNGKTVSKLGSKVDPKKDTVKYNGEILKLPEEYIYYAINKPIGYTTTLEDPHADHIVSELLPNDLPRLVPVGRLDKESEGLLIMTNDGDLVNELTHPRYKHEKEYHVTAEGRLKNNQRDEMKDGITIDDEIFRVKEVEKISQNRSQGQTSYKVILNEGKKRQIRRMFGMYGLAVVKLVRIRVGKLKIGDLKTRGYRQIAKSDII